MDYNTWFKMLRKLTTAITENDFLNQAILDRYYLGYRPSEVVSELFNLNVMAAQPCLSAVNHGLQYQQLH